MAMLALGCRQWAGTANVPEGHSGAPLSSNANSVAGILTAGVCATAPESSMSMAVPSARHVNLLELDRDMPHTLMATNARPCP